jgi:hypothetical protein
LRKRLLARNTIGKLLGILFGVVGAVLLAIGIVYSALELSEGAGLSILGLATIIVTLIVYVLATDGYQRNPAGIGVTV